MRIEKGGATHYIGRIVWGCKNVGRRRRTLTCCDKTASVNRREIVGAEHHHGSEAHQCTLPEIAAADIRR